jgi:hypothetical protein
LGTGLGVGGGMLLQQRPRRHSRQQQHWEPSFAEVSGWESGIESRGGGESGGGGSGGGHNFLLLPGTTVQRKHLLRQQQHCSQVVQRCEGLAGAWNGVGGGGVLLVAAAVVAAAMVAGRGGVGWGGEGQLPLGAGGIRGSSNFGASLRRFKAPVAPCTSNSYERKLAGCAGMGWA